MRFLALEWLSFRFLLVVEAEFGPSGFSQTGVKASICEGKISSDHFPFLFMQESGAAMTVTSSSHGLGFLVPAFFFTRLLLFLRSCVRF